MPFRKLIQILLSPGFVASSSEEHGIERSPERGLLAAEIGVRELFGDLGRLLERSPVNPARA